MQKFLSYTDAVDFISDKNIMSRSDYTKWIKIKNINNLPAIPSRVYKKNWMSWSHYLNNNSKKSGDIDYYSFLESREIVRRFKFKNRSSFYNWVRNICNDIRIPREPNIKYKETWISWSNFLGNDNHRFTKRDYPKYIEFINFIKTNNFKSKSQYIKYIKLNNLFYPIEPSSVYMEFTSWTEILEHPVYLSYLDSRNFVIKLGLRSYKEWFGFIKSGKKPKNIPFSPERVYKNKGWTTFSDFLGYDKCLSTGESLIEEYLKLSNIEYISQYKFENCKNIRKLPFDFYIPKFNLCLEYDGRQHFEIVYNTKSFLDTKINDEIKTNYCVKNNIKLIRLNYKQKDDEIIKILSNLVK